MHSFAVCRLVLLANLRSAVRPLSVLLLIAITALLVQPDRPAHSRSSGRPAPGHQAMPTLEGGKAIEHLKQQGLYDSLAEAMAAVKYEARWQTSPKLAGVGAAFEMRSRAHNLLTYVTGDGFEVTSSGEREQPWRMGLTLKSFGYGDRREAVAGGETTAKGNRVEIKRPGGITEWYVNSGRGVEQGFDIPSPPGEAKEGEPLRLHFVVSGDLKASGDTEGQSITFTRESDGVLLSYDKLSVEDAKGRAVEARLTVENGELDIVIEDGGAEYPLMVDPLLTQQAKLTASDGAGHDQFGGSVAVSGDTAVVGAVGGDGANTNQGSAYVFVRNGTSWVQQAELTAADGAASDRFGQSVAISGDAVAVGASLDEVGANADQGSAYVFVRSGATWTQQQKLTASNGATNDQFGWSVAISDDTVVVGAYGGDVGAALNQGSAYVFVRSGTSWAQQQQLTASDGVADDFFGWSVGISGDTVVVGANDDDVGPNANQGSAYVFVRSGTTWTQQQKLTASDGAANDVFGGAVAISGDTVVVGATGDDVGANTDQGSAYVFVRNGTSWTQQAKLTASDGAASDFFGTVAISNDTVVVGAERDDVGANADQGSAYVFVRNGATWTQKAQVSASDGAASDRFGTSVAVSGDTIVAGANFGDVGANVDQGSAYVFVRNGTSWVQQTQVTASDGAASDFFGGAVAISGDTAVISAVIDDVGANADQGSAYVFVRSGTTWTQQAKLTASDGAAGDQFGTAVAISNDTVVVGAERDDVGANADQGSASVFVRNGTSWTQQAKVTANDGAAADRFGASVAINIDTIIVGANFDDLGTHTDQGSAYVFVRSGTSWAQQAQLFASDGVGFDQFGGSVAVSGDTAVVGAVGGDGANTNQGSAYVFVRNGTSWVQQAELTAADGAASDRFGQSVAISGDAVAVGASLDDVGANADQGSAYVFVRSGATWTQQAKLTASDGAARDNFGISVALSNDTIVVGAYEDSVGAALNQGSAYVFVRSGTSWAQQQQLTASNGAADDQFGVSVGISGDTVVVGANLDDVGANADQGSAYVFVCVWSEQSHATAADGAGNDTFGRSVAVSGDTVVVGADGDDVGASANQGSAYVFVRSGTGWAQQAQLIASDGAASDSFGEAVAISGDTIVVGAYADDVGASTNQGTAYVFVRSGTSWAQQAQLIASDGATNDSFGISVAIGGDTAVVGAQTHDVGANADQGSAYVFVRSGTGWAQQAQLTASDGAASDQFGIAVAISGDTIVVGANHDDVGVNQDQGSAYVFVRSGTSWTQQQKLTAGDGAGFDTFGSSVGISADTVVVGASADDVGANSGQGSAYVFVRSGTSWTQQAKLTASDGAASDAFGISVAISGDTVVIGAARDDVGANADQGSAYVSVRSGATWVQHQQLTASDGTVNDRFGGSVAVSGNILAVGAIGDDVGANANQGSTYIFYMLCNTAPIIVAGSASVTRQQGSPATTSTIATVFDSEDPVSTLNVTVASVPAGVTVTGITNSNGTVSASIGANCSAAIGSNIVILQVTDTDGAIGRVQLLVNVTAAAVTITAQPASQSVCEGSTATFTVMAATAVGYQWRKNGVNIGGATSSNYTTPPTTPADNGALYSVVVTGACNSTLTSNDATLTVNSYMLSANSANFPASGGSGSVTVTVAGSCPWTAVSNNGFITITSGSSGSGNGTVNYTVGANSGSARSGTMTIAGQTFTVNQSAPTAIELVSFTATNFDKGTLIEWRTGLEVGNLGFRLYREADGKRDLITPHLIAGSALKAGADLQSGEGYAWWDGAATPSASYWLEDIDLNGQSTWRGPFYPQAATGAAPARAKSVGLAAVGQPAVTLPTRPVERVAVSASQPLPQSSTQVSLAGLPALKIGVRHEGWYRVTFAELAAAGFDTLSDSRLWQLFAGAEEVPMLVTSGKGGSDSGAALEFYGLGLDTPATDTRTYWLISGNRPGRRIERVKGGGSPAAQTSFMQTVERHDRTTYFAALLNGEAENFFGAVVATEAVEQTIELRHLDAASSQQATVEVRLQGVTSLPHRVQVQLNGGALGEIEFGGKQQGTGRFEMAASMLREGSNSLRLMSAGGPSDISLVDRVRVSYPHTFTADDDALTLTISGGQRLTITGFTSAAIRAFDVTDQTAPRDLVGEVSGGKLGYQINVAAEGGGPRRLLVTTAERLSRAASKQMNAPSQWRDPKHEADLLILTEREFFAALQPLVRLREAQGLMVQVADVEDVFDEFNNGNRSPQALRDFFAYTQQQWAGKPRYLLLVGDASYDPRNYLGYGMNDVVPTKLMDTGYLETMSDDWLGDFDGDGISDIAIGRLPVRNSDEVSAVVAKLLRYEQGNTPAAALLVSDRNEGFDFEAASASLRGLLGGLRIEELRRGQQDAATAKKTLYAALAGGERLVNYVGHGSATSWNGQLLESGEAEGLTNASLPVFVMMNCLNGYFADAGGESLAEALIKAPNGGAIAAWASTGMTLPEAQAAVNQAFYRLLLQTSLRGSRGITLGEAAQQSKMATEDRDVRRTWVLLGDPSMHLR